jgi:hypothetical protein
MVGTDREECWLQVNLPSCTIEASGQVPKKYPDEDPAFCQLEVFNLPLTPHSARSLLATFHFTLKICYSSQSQCKFERGKERRPKGGQGLQNFCLELHVSPTLAPEPQPDSLQPSRKVPLSTAAAPFARFSRAQALSFQLWPHFESLLSLLWRTTRPHSRSCG